jgi:membrane protein insertase Oxa1/YidC/SpoIIIJ
MVLQQRMIPSSGTSPEQQRILNVMSPVLAGVMSWSVAAGLGLYWLTGTIVGIVQQAVMNRTS